MTRSVQGLFVVCFTLAFARADDWPEFRGKGRLGVWNESGILEKFPEKGLTVVWRTPIRAGFAGPSVSAGRVYVTDFERSTGMKGTERVLCLDEKSGKTLWTREWDADYRGIGYAIGPRATPTVDGDRVYVVGASGVFHCLDSRTGEVIWRKDYVKDYGTEMPGWGISGAPLVYKESVIAILGGKPDATVVAFDKRTGRENWRALRAESDHGYSQPVLTRAGGLEQLIIWHPTALFSLDPAKGSLNWQQPFRINLNVNLSTPVTNGNHLLVSSFYNGSMLLEVTGATSKLVWKGKSASEIQSDGLHTVVNTPVIDGDYLYGICSYGQFRCLNLKTGERVWETLDVTREKARWASGFIVRQGDRYFINNDRGELIIAKLSPEGYREIGRTALIKPTTNPGNRRELGLVNWSHPAYANRRIYARNDEEIVCYSAAAHKP